MKSSLTALLDNQPVVLTDGATGTNYMLRGLGAGEPPEFWNFDKPNEVLGLHRQFIEAGAEIILTNTFGCNRQRLKLHKAENRVYELAKRAAELARETADAAAHPVVVAGSVGPTGELFQPLGELTLEAALESFEEQMRGLRDGGTDVVWIETLSSTEELNAAAEASIKLGLPYVVTCTFDTAGRTMMGVLPNELDGSIAGQPVAPLAIGANCRRRLRYPGYSAGNAAIDPRAHIEGQLRRSALPWNRVRVLRDARADGQICNAGYRC